MGGLGSSSAIQLDALAVDPRIIVGLDEHVAPSGADRRRPCLMYRISARDGDDLVLRLRPDVAFATEQNSAASVHGILLTPDPDRIGRVELQFGGLEPELRPLGGEPDGQLDLPGGRTDRDGLPLALAGLLIYLGAYGEDAARREADLLGGPTFDDLDAVDTFDGIWASFSLLHAPKSDFARHLAAIGTALRRAGHLHLGMKLGTGERRDTLGRFYAYYTEAELAEALRAAGFTILDSVTAEGQGLAGTVDPFVLMTAHRG